MVGLDNSGKTTIVLRINGEDTSVVSPTLGFNIKTITYQKYTLNIWDVGGQKTIRSYWRNYFEQTDGLVWVVDSSDLRRLEDCKMELDNLLKEERLSGSSLLILANKQDIKGALTPEEIAKVLNLEAMDKTRHWEIVGCSAYTGDGLLEGFDWLVQDIASRIYKITHFWLVLSKRPCLQTSSSCPSGCRGGGGGMGMNINDIFADFFGGRSMEDEEKNVKGDDLVVKLDATLEDVYLGGSLNVRVMSQL
ncbi:ADP-ribosylation factor-like protein 2 [Prunus yedoensis var. nudiflora]|uniref:ADP-ribosylation factor-like protein 2 n=1 Tax=Prunus yedoensis var. nudiflora TaxID=2094558 RepID=A0A314UA58_PRUYE|nr:ADP-ribosylation factor-like protein 2 [Prunus yedoensis var. nudiflora]